MVRSFVAKNFVSAMAFLNAVAKIAEEQGHHPDLHLTQYRNVEIRLQTHSMGGEEGGHCTQSVAVGLHILELTPHSSAKTSKPTVPCLPRTYKEAMHTIRR